ncbi:MAG: ABC transporter permease [Dehalococcoidia bacterium]|nr:ABC transporter permease [Dehalococcoidia bacterium]
MTALPHEADAATLPVRRPRLSFGWVRSLPKLPVAILVIVLLAGVLAPLIQPHDPIEGDLSLALKEPVFNGGDWDYPLGTDHQGRDVLSRLVAGARVSILIGFSVVIGAGTIGVVIALLAGYLGGWVDQVLSRLTDVLLSMPFLLVAIAVVGAVGAGVRNLMLILIFMGWAQYARVLRGEVLRIRNADFVRLARVNGAGPVRLMALHIFPNITNTLIVLATLQLGTTILIEATLSFLGLGVPPPEASWGGMLNEGRPYLTTQPWMALIPGITIMLTVLAVNLLGDWLRLRLDPRFRQL